MKLTFWCAPGWLPCCWYNDSILIASHINPPSLQTEDTLSAIVNAVLPLFALILLGYAAARRSLFGEAAVDSLNKFVVWMALPALLFQAMAQIKLQDINQPGFVIAFIVSTTAVFLTSCVLDRHRKRRLADISLEGLAASYANAGFMGIPLVLILFGDAALPPTIIITLLTACGLFAWSIVLIEFDLQASPNLVRTFWKVIVSLFKNPLVIAPLLGLALAIGRVELPYAVLQFTTLLGSAASPCALITIGLFLARSQPSSQHGPVWRIVGLKLVLHPLLTAILVYWVFDMPRLWADTAVLLSALPVGTGPFMLATLYQRDGAISSRAILISTVLSLITVSILVTLF